MNYKIYILYTEQMNLLSFSASFAYPTFTTNNNNNNNNTNKNIIIFYEYFTRI